MVAHRTAVADTLSQRTTHCERRGNPDARGFHARRLELPRSSPVTGRTSRPHPSSTHRAYPRPPPGSLSRRCLFSTSASSCFCLRCPRAPDAPRILSDSAVSPFGFRSVSFLRQLRRHRRRARRVPPTILALRKRVMTRGFGHTTHRDLGRTNGGMAIAPFFARRPAYEEDLSGVGRGGSTGLGPAGAPRKASRAAERGTQPPGEEQGGSGHVWLGA